MTRTLADLAASVDRSPEPGWDRVTVSDISDHSRDVRPGAVFVAIRGTTDDGSRYVADALANGAVAVVGELELPENLPVPLIRVSDARRALAVLSDTFYRQPTQQLFTVGVTGTNGKTTVCHLSRHLLGSATTEIIGTIANVTHGLAGLTTPSPPAVHRIARGAVDRGCCSLVVEASSIGLAQHRLDAVAFDVGVFTNLTHDHLDLHGSIEAYFESKLTLFRALPTTGWAVVPVQSPWTERLLAQTDAQAMTYGIGSDADVAADSLELGKRGTRFRLVIRGTSFNVDLPLPGTHNVENALAAAAVALCAERSPEEIVKSFSRTPGIPGRLERYRRDDGALAVVDFAHSPDALERTLRTVRAGRRRVIVVFGCPGEADEEKRPIMGEISGRLADVVFLTADNPKHESLNAILDEIESGLTSFRGTLQRIPDRETAIDHAVALADSRDVILIAGKGHEAYQIVGSEHQPYSDAEVLRALGFVPDMAP